MFHLIERYLWIIGLLFAFLNNYSLRSQAKQKTALHPELVDSYRRYVLGDLIFYSAPWLVMGIGILIGGVPSVFDFLKPCSGNPFADSSCKCNILFFEKDPLWRSIVESLARAIV